MAIWKAYIDCAGSANSTFIVTGIVLATANTWKKLEPRWKAVLHKYQLSHFHASDFNNFAGEYKKLTAESQLQCQKELIEELGKINLQYIIHVIRKSEFSLALKQANMSKKAEAYDYLLEIAISDLMNRFAKRGLDSSLCVFIEAGEKHNSIAFQDLLKLCKHGIFGKIKHLELVGKKGNFSLQVADMIAYEGFRVATNETGPIKRPERKSFTVIKAGNPLNYYLHHSVSAKYWLENIHNGVYGEDKATGANK